MFAGYIQLSLIGLLPVFSSISMANTDCMNESDKNFLEYRYPDSFVSFFLYDRESDVSNKIIIGNGYLANFLSTTGKLGETKKPGYDNVSSYDWSYDSDFVTDYVDFIKDNGGEDLTLDLGEFKNFIVSTSWNGRIDHATNFIQSKYYVEKDKSFTKFNVENEDEFIAKYVYVYKTATGSTRYSVGPRYTGDPAFIAILRDLGYIVLMSPIQPTVFINPIVLLKKKQG